MSPPTVNIGSAKLVGTAHSKAMPSSHETSTMRLPGRKAARSAVFTYSSGRFGSCSVQLTTMSLSARNGASGTRPSSVMTSLRYGPSSWSNWIICAAWIGAATDAVRRLVRTRTSCTPCARRAVTAPRAVAPNPITTAVSRRP